MTRTKLTAVTVCLMGLSMGASNAEAGLFSCLKGRRGICQRQRYTYCTPQPFYCYPYPQAAYAASPPTAGVSTETLVNQHQGDIEQLQKDVNALNAAKMSKPGQPDSVVPQP
jgi:hypothetical protein